MHKHGRDQAGIVDLAAGNLMVADKPAPHCEALVQIL